MRGTVAPGGDMWQLAVDGLLVQLVDTHLQVCRHTAAAAAAVAG